MLDEDKAPYEPSQRKRFEVSKDPYSRERLWALRDTIRELKLKHPFVVGAILFGSLSKGKQLNKDTVGQSDIDAVIYIDEDGARKEYPSLLEGENKLFSELVEVDNEIHADYDGRTNDEKMYELIGTYVNALAEDSIRGRLPHHKLFKQHSIGIGINTKSISIKGQNSINQTFERVFFSYLAPNGSKLERLKRAIKDLESGKPERSILDISAIAMPWLLDVGGGLAEYRKNYLMQLRELDSVERELRWKTTIAAVQYYERKASIPQSIENQYPQTYEKALRYYGVVIN